MKPRIELSLATLLVAVLGVTLAQDSLFECPRGECQWFFTCVPSQSIRVLKTSTNSCSRHHNFVILAFTVAYSRLIQAMGITIVLVTYHTRALIIA